ncbi:MAG: hypothetical protein LQ350_004461 [Teloschistes chrysophthalmus]|nr:MAG: hypothetical protein LQ350_004461 [Niorma chrysophthalma]
MEHLSRFRKSASQELSALENALKEILARRDEQVVENRRLRSEIGLLQQQVARVSELEDEVRCLKEDLESDRRVSSARTFPDIGISHVAKSRRERSKSPLEQPYVKIEHLEKCRQQFLECSRELERVRKARDVLEGKARHFKHLCKTLRRRQSPLTVAEEGRFNVDGSFRRRDSAPARQFDSGMEANWNQGQSSRHLMPEGLAEPSQTLHRLNAEATLRTFNKTPQSQRRNARLSEDGIDNTTPAGQAEDDSTETSDESDHPSIKGESRQTPNLSRPPATSAQSDMDEPIVVSERSLKRKRDQQHPDVVQNPKRIKAELLSSSPNPNVPAEGAQESIDLDEVSGSLSTPRKDHRKRQRMWDDLSPPPSIDKKSGVGDTGRLLFEDAEEQPESSSSTSRILVPEQLTAEATISAEDVESMPEWVREQGQQYAERAWMEEKRKRKEDRRAKQKIHNERQLRKSMEAKSLQASSVQRQSVAIQDHWSARNQALQPIDTNRPLPRTSNHPSDRVQKMTPGIPRHAQYIHMLAEDGEPNLSTEKMLPGGGKQRDAKASHERAVLDTYSKTDTQPSRLNRLLAAPSPDRPPISPENAGNAKVDRIMPPERLRLFPKQSPKINETLTRTSDPRTPITRLKNPSSINRTSIATKETANAYITPFSKPRPSSKSHQTDPLRSRPLSQLCLEDFKINPKHNQGFEYAFKEVVRKPEQRKCMPGCTRPDCCGAIFRKMAETGMYRNFHTTLAPAPSQEDEDERIMQDFLGCGPGAAGKLLRRMTGAERAETLLQAKTKILADHFGRHREVYAREPSPVGFWDVDMPDSQEAVEQGRLAEIRMRQKVEERWREARKGDAGVWKFRDE